MICTTELYYYFNFSIKRWPAVLEGMNKHYRTNEENVTECRSFFHELHFLLPWHMFHSIKLCPQRSFNSALCLFGLTVLLLHHFSKDPWSLRCTWSVDWDAGQPAGTVAEAGEWGLESSPGARSPGPRPTTERWPEGTGGRKRLARSAPRGKLHGHWSRAPLLSHTQGRNSF